MKRFFRPMGLGLGCLLGFVSCASECEFDRADADDDQQLTTEEVEDRLVEAIFEKEDRNADGKVTPAEWLEVNPGASVTHFHPRDTNKDQFVDLEEFQKYADDAMMFDKALSLLDPNKDGLVSPDEAEKMLSSVEQ